MSELKCITAEQAYYAQYAEDDVVMFQQTSNGAYRQVHAINRHTPNQTYTGQFALYLTHGWDEIGAEPDMIVDGYFPIYLQEATDMLQDEFAANNGLLASEAIDGSAVLQPEVLDECKCTTSSAPPDVECTSTLYQDAVAVTMTHRITKERITETICFTDYPEMRKTLPMCGFVDKPFLRKSGCLRLVRGVSWSDFKRNVGRLV